MALFEKKKKTKHMKKTILNLGAILMAFIIGVTINNACAGSIDDMSDSELRNLVIQLQQEVNNLKNLVSELEDRIERSSGSNSGNAYADGGFEVDGIHFDRSGNPDSPYDYVEYFVDEYRIFNGERQENNKNRLNEKYNYDSKGRISMIETTYLSPSSNIKSSITQNSYSNKTITTTFTNKYVDGASVSEIGYSTVYHLK